MPLLFAATLFVSASLLFMVQPMVGKMVLPLLGGSPAVWNACMVFFQALLLLGYLYAHKVASIESPRRQATIHLLVLALPIAVFGLSAAFGARHTPIAIAESLAPTDEKSPILSVLAILTVAIGVPFFVVSTTATLLQKWFVYTGHPSARDPYFLYAASNVGSLISLLGYPLVIEPRLPIDGQAWVFAVGFGILAAMIAVCARAANNPIGVPPPPSPAGGKKAASDAKLASVAAQMGPPAAPPVEAPPTLLRKLKWVALAFVPSTLMLGVTFHMTTDIASVPLLWVGPLALYLITFVIVFGTVRGMLQLAILLPGGFFLAVGLMSDNTSLLGIGVALAVVFAALQFADWLGIPNMSLADSGVFRIVIGNLAPVMILLLVFVMISDVQSKVGVGLQLLLYNLTFFAASLMCHYELARDRPSPKYLTEFFLLMSVGGMLGGVFNSLLAPLIFTHAYEFPFALIVACLMVPKLIGEADEKEKAKEPAPAPAAAPRRSLGERAVELLPLACVILNTVLLVLAAFWLFLESRSAGKLGESLPLPPRTLMLVLGGLFLFGIVSVVLAGRSNGGQPGRARELWDRLPPGGKAAALVVANPVALPWAGYKVIRTREQFRTFLDFVIPVLVGVGFYLLTYAANRTWFSNMCVSVSETINLPPETIVTIFVYAVPVMVCFFFVDRPLRFALAVAAILGPVTYREAAGNSIHAERSFFGILKITEHETESHLRTVRYKITKESITELRAAKLPDSVLSKLESVFDQWIVSPEGFTKRLNAALGEDAEKYRDLVAKHAVQDRAVLLFPEGAKDGQGESVEGTPIIANHSKFRKLVHGTTLHGTQFVEDNRDFRDDFMMIWPNVTPWDAVAVTGAIHAYDARQEPLTYYHRTGPVGAMFSELRRRKNRADEKAHFAMVGLGTGSASCYAYPGQKITFYEIDPAVKKLVADTDKYFSYVTAARNRGAILDIRMGDARLKLKQDEDRKYTLLLVDAFSSDSIPVHLLTVEAVQLYLDRLTEDGILALHISNKYVKLEPVVSAIANKLGLAARVWNDDSEGRSGKTASSWVVLARKAEHLGDLYSPLGDLPFALKPEPNGDDPQRYGTVATQTGSYYRHLINMPVFAFLLSDYDTELEAKGEKKEKYKELNESSDPKAKWLEWVDAKIAKNPPEAELARLRNYRMLIDRYGPGVELADAMHALHGHAFRRLETLVDVPAWTDDYSDVLRVMQIQELQKVRKFFGLPTPVER